MIAITEQPISLDAVLESVRRDDAGGLSLFAGTVRDHHAGKQVEALGYSAHEALSQTMLERLADEATRRFDLSAVSIVHRIGDLEIGDVAVAVAVSAAHRDAAFRASRFLIDTLKRTVPIWKRERYADGEVWIEGDQHIPTR